MESVGGEGERRRERGIAIFGTMETVDMAKDVDFCI